MVIRDKKGRYSSTRRFLLGVLKYILIILVVLSFLLLVAEKFVRYRERKEWIWDTPIKVSFDRVLTIKDREQKMISPIVIQRIEGDGMPMTVEEKKILELWGERYYLLARAIFKCESGLKADAINWSSKDVGYTQINLPSWETRAKEVFGYSVGDLFDPIKNITMAFYIWDIDNGVLGDSIGSFNDWVVYQNDSYLTCAE